MTARVIPAIRFGRSGFPAPLAAQRSPTLPGWTPRLLDMKKSTPCIFNRERMLRIWRSHIAARVATTHNLPFAAFRVVADPVHRRLPHAALVALKSDGSLAYGAIAGSILRDPSQIPQLLRIASDAQAAFLALFRSRKLIAGTLGFTDFREFLLDVPAEDVLGGPLQV